MANAIKSKKSAAIWSDSLKIFPGGVNSPVRAFGSVDREPIAIASGKGCYVHDEDGNKYLDFLNSWGPLILGHSNKTIQKELRKQLKKGTSFGTVTAQERDMGSYILKHLPHIDKIRFMSSGTEAVMAGVRLARAYTKRPKIVKFSGCYHGHFDSVLVNAGSGMLTFTNDITEASSPGVPQATVADTVVLPLDDEQVVEEAFSKLKGEIAAVMIEPLPANSGLLPQRTEFLQFLRDITQKNDALLLFDEVISGFRLAFGGFTEKYGVHADLYTYGKVIGGGLPVGALGGKNHIMEHLSPSGKVYQAGTLSGNPMAMTAGLTAMKILREEKIHKKLSSLSQYMANQFEKQIGPALKSKDWSVKLEIDESIFWLSFQNRRETETVRQIDKVWEKSPEIYTQCFSNMIENSIYIAPSSYEVGFISAPMKKKHIDHYLKNLKASLTKTVLDK